MSVSRPFPSYGAALQTSAAQSLRFPHSPIPPGVTVWQDHYAGIGYLPGIADPVVSVGRIRDADAETGESATYESWVVPLASISLAPDVAALVAVQPQ
jgi:hypothetical protein